MPSARRFFLENSELFLAAALALIFCALARLAAGASFGVALAALFSIAIIVPPLAGARPALSQSFAIALITAAGAGTICITLIGNSQATLAQWISLCLILLAFAFGVSGLVQFLRRIVPPPLAASALTVVFALAWLTWPIWLSRPLAELPMPRLAAALIFIHPPLTANGILIFTAPWTEQSMAYRLTLLDQDIPMRLPSTALPCVSAHILLGALFYTLSYFWKPSPQPLPPAAV